MIESGEVIIVRVLNKKKPFVLQLQVLESDFLDSSKNAPDKGLVQGIQYDNFGAPSQYWLFDKHPGEASSQSKAVSANDVIHLYRMDRPGQARGISWIAPVVIPLKKLSDFEDALLEKAHISNLFTAFLYDSNSDGLSTATDQSMEPGAIITLPPGKQIDFADPPQPAAPKDFLNHQLRAIATGTGFPYELLSGNLSEVNFSTARLSFNEFARLLEDWRFNTIIPMFLDRIWLWCYETFTLAGLYRSEIMPKVIFTPPKRIMVDVFKDTAGTLQKIRAGLLPPSDALREEGYNPKDVFNQYQADFALFDQMKLVFESDPRKDAERKVQNQGQQK